MTRCLLIAAVWTAATNWYYTALYPYCDHAAGADWAAKAQAVRFDNPEINGLDVFRESVPVYHAQRKPPEAASGLATWRTLAENFLPGERDAEILTGNPDLRLSSKIETEVCLALTIQSNDTVVAILG